MRKVKKKNILERIDDSINDKIDEMKNKSKSKKNSYNKKNSKKNSNSKGKTVKKKKRAIWKRILTFILILCIIGVLSVTAFLGYVVITAPEFDESALSVKDQTVIYDIDGNIITTLGVEKRESVTYDQLPQVLIDAIIATEDSRFFQHNGVDLLRFVKATFLQLLGRDEAGGASTLTMQTVKNNLTKKDAKEEKTFQKIVRKFQDVYLAVFKVEKEYSKEEILEIYVNDNYLGGSYWGVEEASKYYFGKSVSELTLPEASMIAGLFQLPGANNPYNNIDGATARRKLVLQYMVNHGYITKQEKELAEKVSIESLLVGGNSNNSGYQGYIDTVVTEVEKLTGNNPYKIPMKIYTTMERSIQDGVNKVLNDDKAAYWKDANATAGIAIVNVETGAVAAVGGGRNKTGERVFNNATQALKQPGSTAKPIFDYGPGIEYNNFSTYTLWVDEPWTYTNGPSVNNWDARFHGLVTTRYALQYSRNIPALKAFQQVGPKNSQKFAYSLGLDVALNSSSENYRVINEETGLDNTINEAYSIGGVAEGFTPLQMASAYSAFASGGYYTESHAVTKIEYRETGEVQEFKYTKTRVMKDSTAYLMNNILESAVTSGFNGGANVYGSHVAAKTGTTNFDEATMKARKLPSNAVNDLWTIAYTSKYSIGVWYGYESLTDGYNISSGNYKERLTSAVMQYIPKDTKGWSMPSSVVAVQVERETWPAALPSQYTPSNMITTEYFVRGTQPTEVSERYMQLNNITNVNTQANGNSVTISWNFETPKVLTESYIKNYFNKSVFGNSKANYASARINYNNTTLGPIVFAIYKYNSDGTLSLVDTTSNNSYTYEGYGKATLLIKTEHSKFKSNASTGIKVDVTLDENTSANTDQLVSTFNGSTTVRANAGTYEEKGFKSIYYGNINVTNTATIQYKITVNNDTSTFNSKSEFEAFVNQLSAGTYQITYIVSYLNYENTKNRTLILS